MPLKTVLYKCIWLLPLMSCVVFQWLQKGFKFKQEEGEKDYSTSVFKNKHLQVDFQTHIHELYIKLR